jgi:hypothetical protein
VCVHTLRAGPRLGTATGLARTDAEVTPRQGSAGGGAAAVGTKTAAPPAPLGPGVQRNSGIRRSCSCAPGSGDALRGDSSSRSHEHQARGMYEVPLGWKVQIRVGS